MEKQKRNIGFFELAVSFFVWSSWIIPARLLGENLFVLPFFLSLFVSIGWGAILLARSRRSLLVGKNDLARLFLQAVFFQLNMITYLGALKYTDAAIAVLTHYTAPIFVAILAPVILKEKITGRIIFSLLMAIGGFVIIFFKISTPGPDLWLGAFLGLASGFCYALIIMLAKDLLNRVKGEVILFYQNFFGVFLLLFFMPLATLKTDSSFYWQILIAAALYPGFASYLYMRGLRKVESVKASIVGYLEPLGTITWGWLFFNEDITIRTVIGGFFILYSGYHVAKQEKTGTMN